MDEGRFLVFHLLGVLATLAEVGVLVDGAGDEAWYRSDFLLVCAEDVWETRCETGSGLSGGEEELSDVVTIVENQ